MFEDFYNALEAIGYVHPVHPTQINMPIGLVIGAFILAIVAILLKRPLVAKAARYTALLAFLFLFPTIAGGIMDWQHFFGGVWLNPVKIKIALGIFLFLLLLISLFVGRKTEKITGGLFLVYLLSTFTVVALGYYGGEIVFGDQAPRSLAEYRVGESAFRGNCSGCHPFGGNSIVPQDPVIGSDELENFEPFLSWIRSPYPPMPSFPPTDIPDEQARALFDYLNYFWGKHGHSDS